MNLIKLELVEYDFKCNPTPSEVECYIDESRICGAMKEVKKLSGNRTGSFYSIYTVDGREFSVSEECYNRLVGPMAISEGPNIESRGECFERPKINPGKPFKLW